MRRLGGWEPAVETVYEYDDAGRLIRSVSRCEPEFNGEQVAYLLASREISNEPRGPHGFPMAVATAASTRGKVRVEATVDHIEREITQTREAFKRDYAHQDQAGWFFHAHLVD